MRLLSTNRTGPVVDAEAAAKAVATVLLGPSPPSFAPMTWEPDDADNLADAGPTPPAVEPPPHGCPDCATPGVPFSGSPFFWEDIGGNLHCCECVPIFSRRAAVELWRIVGRWDPVAGREVLAWSVWEPRPHPRGMGWNPWEYVERQDAEAKASVAAIAKHDEEF